MSSSLSFNPGTSASTQASQNPWAQAQSQFQQLGQALSSGNLSAAQAAFSALQQNAPQGGQSSQNAQGSSAQSPMAALSQALQSGNLSAAQQAFSQIQQAQGYKAPSALVGLNPSRPIQRTYSYSGGFQQEIGWGSMLDMAYVGSLGRDLIEGENMDEAQLAAKGANSSLIHVDWMIGSAKMDVDGVNADGTAEPLMRAGEWV